MGFTTDLMFKIGVLEVILAVAYLIPQTAFIATILLTGYLGGATLTHLRGGLSIVPPVLFGVAVWFGFGFRRPEMFSLLCCHKCTTNCTPAQNP
jgi:hypothetical protein